ncbi:MAG: hypothetical protein JWQ09_4416 [Segetibacter sp.]|nr:hypothetical protein [Segetibacter sp.]
MKKLVFAVQVFGLIIAFPIYVLLEFNHGTKALPTNNSVAVTIENPVHKNIQQVINSKIENENKVCVNGSKKCYEQNRTDN